MVKYEEEKGEDRVSELPRSILHEILSRIPMKEVGRTSVLSKRWNYIWETFPFLNFDEEFYVFRRGNNNKKSSIFRVRRKNEHLMKKAEQMILNRCREEEDPNLLTLRWIIPKDKAWKSSNLQTRRLIPNLAKTRLQDLSIINYPLIKGHLKLHSPLILSESIKTLYFYGVGELTSLLPYSTLKFKYLTTIELENVIIEDEVVNGLNLVCPVLESLRILDSRGLENLYFVGLPKLKNLVLMQLWIKTLKIESLSKIEFLCIKSNHYLSWVHITDTNMDSLRQLRLYGDFLTQDLFNEFVCKCRFLKVLDMGDTENLHNINISIDTIKKIIINNVEKLDRIEMITPMLEDFQICTYIYRDPPIILWNFPTRKIDIFVELITYYWLDYVPDDDKFEIWQNFFGYFSHAKELQLLIPPKFLIWIERKELISPFFWVENIVYYHPYYNPYSRISFSILLLLKSLIFLAPHATTISFKNNATTKNNRPSDIIFKIEYGEKGSGEGTLSAWLSVSKVIVEKYHGNEWDWKELIMSFGKIKNLKFVLPEKKNKKLKFLD